MDFDEFPKLNTGRLLLRKLDISDADEILFLRSDKRVNRYIERPEDRQTKNLSDASQFIKNLQIAYDDNQSISWGITLKNDRKIIGTICLWNFSENGKNAEVGYDLTPELYNKGIMNEALGQIIEFGFKEFELDRIDAYTHKENTGSIRLLTKNGFKLNADRLDQMNPLNEIYEIRRK